jgi:hypothetical protein
MKQLIRVSLIMMLVVMLHGITLAQTEQPPVQPEPSAEHHNQMGEQPSMESPPMMANMLEQIANTLGQPNVSPETLKQVAEQMKQLAELMKQMPVMREENRMQPPMPPMMNRMQPPMMNRMPGMQEGDRMQQPMQPPMMDEMAGNMSMMMRGKMMGNMTEIKPPMTPDKSMMPMDPMLNMIPMMQSMRETNHNPKMMGMTMQMRGEMMQAMGAILLKYGKVIAVESEQTKPDANVSQPVNPTADSQSEK